MAAGRVRSTRRLRTWIIEQVSSGKYPGLMWDDDAKTMFRIPWKHAGKQDFRKDEDAAIFKAWAEFKGKLTDGSQENPASWKTRLRCALNKSPEFMEVMERAQLDISEPYKVYRLVPISEQGVGVPEKKCRVKANKRAKRRRSIDSESDDVTQEEKQIKTEEDVSQPVNISQDAVDVYLGDLQIMAEERSTTNEQTEVVDEITVDVRIEENVPVLTEVQESFSVVVYYLGQEVHRRQIQGTDVRITYMPSSVVPPIPDVLRARFPRIQLPEPPSTLPAGQQLQALSTLLPYMEKGVVLTSSQHGVYGTRYCQGRVFWTGPHTTTPGLHKMERNMKPAMLFSKDTFIQQLNDFLSNGGEPPECSITMCFGEILSNTEDPSEKLIIVQITLPWAEQMVQNAQTFNILQCLASQSPQGEITLNLVTVSPEDINCSL